MAEKQPSIEERITAALLPQEETQEQPEQPEQEIVETVEEVEEPVIEEESVETQQESEQVEEVEEAEEPTEETWQVETLGQLAEQIEVDPADLYNLKIPVNGSDGERKEITIGQWKDDWQSKEKSEKIASETIAIKQKLEDQLNREIQQFEKDSQQGAEFLQELHENFLNEFKTVDWKTLEQTDPTQFVMQRQKFADKQAYLENLRSKAAQNWELRQNEFKEKRVKAMGEAIEKEQKALLNAIPEWNDENVYNAESAKIRQFLKTNGYSEDQVNNITDHRFFVMVRNAMQLNDLQDQTKKVRKKTAAKVGKKILKPGAKRTNAAIKQDAANKVRQNLKKSGSVDDAAAAISNLFNSRG
tara:strand:+ start:24393 stop:25466 length:1074 start_codon:yes stop_codon:yes gene_type:complete